MIAPWKRTFYAAWVAQLLAMLGFAFVFPFLPFYVAQLGIHDKAEISRWTGILLSCAGVSMAIASPLWGILADRYGRKPMVLRSMLGGAVVLGLMAFTTNVHQLLVLRLLQGALTGTVAASIALVASVTPSERAGYALGMMQVAVLAGNAIGPFVGGLTVYHFGFFWAFLAAAGLILAGGLLVKFGTREDFTPTPTADKGMAASYRTLFALAGFVIPLATLCLVNFAMTAPGTIFPLFVQELAQADEGAAARITGNILSVTGVVAALGAFGLGRLSDRWGHREMLLTCVIGTAVLSAAQAFAASVGQLFALRILFGLAAAGLIPAANAIIHRVVPRHSIGKAFGATASLGALGFTLGPLVGGYMAAYTLQHYPALSYRPPFIFCGLVLSMVAGLVYWGIKPSLLRSKEAPTACVPAAAVPLAGAADHVPTPPQLPPT